MPGATAVPARTAFEIQPRGPFSWAAAMDSFSRFGPIRRHWQGPDEPLRIAFLRDGDFRPVAAALRFEDDRLVGEARVEDGIHRVIRQIARVFSLDHDGTGYPDVADRDPALGELMARFPGLRPVCFTSPYETAAWAVISQRISMRQAASIQQRLVETLGTRFEIAGGEAWAFPAPDVLLALREVPGLPAIKVERLRAVARAALDGTLDAERLRGLGEGEAMRLLRTIPGVGPFWSSGIYFRGCGVVDGFPVEPLSIAALGHLHGLGDRLDEATIARLTDPYRPYRMWVCFLLRVASARGAIPGIVGREGELRRAFATART